MGKILLVFYSRDGATKKVAEAIARELRCEMEELVDYANREGIFGYLRSGFEAALRRKAHIKPIQHDPARYETVIVGTPVWANNMAPAVRTFLSDQANKIRRIVFFCTCDNSARKAFSEMERVAHKRPIIALQVKTSEICASKKLNMQEFTRLVALPAHPAPRIK